jgi:integrase
MIAQQEGTPALARVVSVSVNLGDLPYFDRAANVDCRDETATVRQARFHHDHIVEGFPLLFCPSRIRDALEMNLFMEHRYRGKFLPPKTGGHRNLKGGVTVETLKNTANSLRGYLAWLAETNTDWREVYAVADGDRAKAWLAPYRYRQHLIDLIKAETLSWNTGNLYMSHVRQFYEWAHMMRRIERLPFTYTRIPIKKRRKDGDFDLLFSTVQDEQTLTIQTSDMAIPKKYKRKKAALRDGLMPYTTDELKHLFESQYLGLESRRLWAQLAFACGLRAMEVAGFPEVAAENPELTDKMSFEVRIVGKFNKERTFLVPRFLMEALWQHRNSPERLRRCAKWDLAHGTSLSRPLFLNRSGKPISSASLTNITSNVAKELDINGIEFKRSFHDLRATFATALAKFMLEMGLPLGFIQYKLMSLLGHTNFSSTMKYINFARSVTFDKQMADWTERIFGGLESVLAAEAKGRK